MAIIAEEEDNIDSPPGPSVEPKATKPCSPSDPATTKPNPFAFWAYFTLAVSLVTLFFVLLPSLSPPDPKSWFLSLPNDLRHYYSKGRMIKVQFAPNQSPVEVFTIQHGPKTAEHVLIVHGLGCNSYSFRDVVQRLGFMGIHAVALDLPGSGFSDKSMVVEGGSWGGVLGRFWDVYSDIQEKGLFWGFDRMIEKGHVPYEEHEITSSTRKVVKPIEFGSPEMGSVLGQVIDSIGLAPVHLVLHDSALGMSANWIAENSGLVRSVTLVDSAPTLVSLPSWVLDVPLAGDLLLGVSVVYAQFLKLCCSNSINVSVAESHRALLKGRYGKQAVVAMGKKLNGSFGLEEWGSLEQVKGIPMQVMWSSSWSKEWSEEGSRVADSLPQAKFAPHFGGRWPQEDVADELAEKIVHFVSSLPKTIREVEEEPLPEHIKEMLNAAAEGDNHHHHSHGHDHHAGHAHGHDASFMDAYGLGHGWGS